VSRDVKAGLFSLTMRHTEDTGSRRNLSFKPIFLDRSIGRVKPCAVVRQAVTALACVSLWTQIYITVEFGAKFSEGVGVEPGK